MGFPPDYGYEGMCTRSKSFEGMRLIIVLASFNCFSQLYHAPRRIFGTSNHTAGSFVMTLAQYISAYSARLPA